MGGALSGACGVGACSVGRLLRARMFDSIARWSGALWDGVKILFGALWGIYFDIRILRYIYLSKVINSLLFQQLLRHKVLARECNATLSAISVLG